MFKVLVLVGSLVALPAFAELERGACKELVKATCGQHKGDRQAMKACMKENKDKFPEECRKRAKKMREHKKEKREQKKNQVEESSES